MGLFKVKKEDINSYETESSLPPFYIDANGFVMFDDKSLGGVSIMEVVPEVFTEAITHEDTIYHDDSTSFAINGSYEPSAGWIFEDARKTTYPGWISFLNSLLPQYDDDEPIHVQILCKKCVSKEWATQTEYAYQKARQNLHDEIRGYKYPQSKKDALIGRRAIDYARMLGKYQEQVNRIPRLEFDVRKIPSYIVKYYLVVSYTPSSEGWWMDGRDTDYYRVDNSMSSIVLSDNDTKSQNLVDKVADAIYRHIVRKSKKDNHNDQEDLFYIEDDRTAQVLETRIRRILDSAIAWNRQHPDSRIPFSIRMMDSREVGALIRFFPDILTPYWDKIWTLKTDQNDVIYNMDVRHSISMDDVEYVQQTQNMFDDIINDNVSISASDEDKQAFLSRYKMRSRESQESGDSISKGKMDIDGESKSISDDLDWSPEVEEAKLNDMRRVEEKRREQQGFWSDFDAELTMDDNIKTDDEKKKEFLSRYKNRAIRNSLNRRTGPDD